MSEYIIKVADWAIGYNCVSLYEGCEEIVRCRDCKHYEYCRFHANRPDKPDGFCAWGERKNNETTGHVEIKEK